MDNKKNIVLIGMMGAGKSTIGHLLDEELLDFRYVDIDKEIEKHAQKTITQIFECFGEAYFRQLEHEMTTKYASCHNLIISTGGGTVENIENIKTLQKNGVIFYLKANADELYNRIKKTTDRPMLKHPNPKQKLEELIKKREPFYQMADFEINTQNKELKTITKEILEKYGNK